MILRLRGYLHAALKAMRQPYDYLRIRVDDI